MKKTTNRMEVTVIESPEVVLENALTKFVMTGMQVVGVEATTQLVSLLTGIIQDEPALARKLANKSVQEELKKMAETMKGGKFSMFDLPEILSKVKSILK
ncbi:hypothetical protein [Tellurirhabdus rosea]|uniref:hypothetical protein n=1 Tax=Tellurirhabdus rosea TaxID=2674997 RepID=UPI00225452A9|nr:hypothetical protein [Tellurirhabdus rosea]